ncbi:MAG: formylglycine-generating enzyme family protein [Bacteroidota bacterium]
MITVKLLQNKLNLVAAVSLTLLVVAIGRISTWLSQDDPASPVEISSQPTEKTDIPIPATVLVKGGTFTMGCQSTERVEDCSAAEKPTHEVSISTFYMGKYEVTNEEFVAFLNAKGNLGEGGTEWVNLNGNFLKVKCRIQKQGDQFVVEFGYEKHPIIYVSWYGARAYCQWLSQKTGKTYRLPSEAEWEYAARGGATGAPDNFLYSGSDELTEVGWWRVNSGRKTHPVGQLKANQLGLYDMSGNVWEFCADPWHNNYTGAPLDGQIWQTNGAKNYHVLRGGSCYNVTWYCRVALRDWNHPSYLLIYRGFRVARDS